MQCVYDEVIRWSNRSWQTTLDQQATSSVYAGNYALGVTHNAGWAGLSLGHSGFDTNSYTALMFAVRTGGQPLSALAVSLYDSSDRPLPQLNPAGYARAAGGGWQVVTIPLSELGAAGSVIRRVQLQDTTGVPQPPYLVDQLCLAAEGAGTGPDPVPEPAHPMMAPVPTPEPGTLNTVVPLLQRPFRGDYPVTNIFDHNLPFQFYDTVPGMHTFWGSRTWGIEGHNGWDWKMPEGVPILAAAPGRVVRAHVADPFYCPVLDRTVDDSLAVEISHSATNGERYNTSYHHLSRADVSVGQVVAAGERIGISGNTGCSLYPHLHFGVFRMTGTKTDRPAHTDPFGWESPEPDPWAEHPQGTESVWLWKDGLAPPIYSEELQALNPGKEDANPVGITVVRWMGWKDKENPNNEFVQIELDRRFVPSGELNLRGARLFNSRGDAFIFPDVAIRSGEPLLVFSGSGAQSQRRLFWGRSDGAWDDMGDCVTLLLPAGQVSRLQYGEAFCEGEATRFSQTEGPVLAMRAVFLAQTGDAEKSGVSAPDWRCSIPGASE